MATPSVPDRQVAAPRLASVLREIGELGALDLPDDGVLEDARVVGGEVPEASEGVELVGCHLTAVAFTGATLRSPRLTDVVLEDCELSGSVWEAASLRRVRFERCRMSGFTAVELAADHVAFVDCKLDAAWLRMARLDHCLVEGCDLSGSDLYEGQLRASSILRSTLDGSELSGATLDGVALHGSTLQGISGALALRGATVGPAQLVDVALAVLPALGITIAEQVDDADGAEG
jgi:uncharacterized protein YjbI with pentapeptide repeats